MKSMNASSVGEALSLLSSGDLELGELRQEPDGSSSIMLDGQQWGRITYTDDMEVVSAGEKTVLVQSSRDSDGPRDTPSLDARIIVALHIAQTRKDAR